MSTAEIQMKPRPDPPWVVCEFRARGRWEAKLQSIAPAVTGPAYQIIRGIRREAGRRVTLTVADMPGVTSVVEHREDAREEQMARGFARNAIRRRRTDHSEASQMGM